MGIPRFYKVIAERYPLSIEETRDNQGFDNLYIDMNGIIHMKTHDNGQIDSSISWDEMSERICMYMEQVFNVVSPKDLLFISVDGVACRMKMNQQRARRFCKVSTKNEDEEFNPNQISPGTEFMEYLQEKILLFIRKKRNINKKWKNINIIFSGHRVPGEGEHKIISYIKSTKKESQKKRHCIHGLDADLILLTMLTNMPQFSILREEMNIKNEKTGKFLYLHTNIVQEYLMLEMGIKQVEAQRIKDTAEDIIFLMTLFGNDFLPSMFELLESFDAVLGMYASYYRYRKERLHRNGVINWVELHHFMEFLVQYERVIYLFGEMKLEVPKRMHRYDSVQLLFEKPQLFYNLAESLMKQYLEIGYPKYITKSVLLTFNSSREGIKCAFLKAFLKKYGSGAAIMNEENKKAIKALKNLPVIENLPKDMAVDAVWNIYKEIRYKKKEIDPKIADSYLLGLQWVSMYYFAECDSWRWFYPCHYPVFLCDVYNYLSAHIERAKKAENKKEDKKEGTEAEVEEIHKQFKEKLQIQINLQQKKDQTQEQAIQKQNEVNINRHVKKQLENGTGYGNDKPVSAFVQLLCILPEKDKYIIPKALHEIFYVLKEYYPLSFKMDQDRKKASWEAFPLIPFIDIGAVEREVEKRSNLLTPEEKKRNTEDSIKLYYKDGEEIEKIPYEEKSRIEAYKKISKCTTNQNNKQSPFIPSLHLKTVSYKMSKVVNSRFRQERKRVVLTVEPCIKIVENTLIVAKKKSKISETHIFSGNGTYIGFPYLVPCKILEIGSLETRKAFSAKNNINSDVESSADNSDSKRNYIEKIDANLSTSQRKELDNFCRSLFRNKGIFVLEREKYAKCIVKEKECIFPLEVIVCSKKITLHQ